MMVLLAGGLAFTGCGKKPTPKPMSGVDLPKLREAFATANPESKPRCPRWAWGSVTPIMRVRCRR